MSFTLREMRRVSGPFWLWLVLSISAAVIGPFGTYEGLSLAERLWYWGVVVAISLGLELTMQHFFPVTSVWAHILLRTAYVCVVGVLVYTLNSLVFDTWAGANGLARALGFVLVVALCIEAAVVVITSQFRTGSLESAASESPSTEGQADKFQTDLIERLPVEKRGELMRLEAQDHYLNIITTNGEDIVLMRLSDAISGLSPASGVQIHRSHWVARAAIGGLERKDGKHILRLRTGSTLPISRSRIIKVRQFIEWEQALTKGKTVQ